MRNREGLQTLLARARARVDPTDFGLAPRADGSCPPGATPRQGSEMMHVWFTHDLRSAYAIHAPERELCVAKKLPRDRCGHAGHAHG